MLKHFVVLNCLLNCLLYSLLYCLARTMPGNSKPLITLKEHFLLPINSKPLATLKERVLSILGPKIPPTFAKIYNIYINTPIFS